MKTKNPHAWANELLQWFAENAREMPWRSHPEPYWVWVSEIMLQQTQVDTVRSYFLRFMERFPTVNALADAPLESVLQIWEGLGYYTRARNLHACAQVIAHTHQGHFPQTFDAWLELPGIGRYTAAAVSSIAFSEKVPVVDGNVLRVFARLFNLNTPMKTPKMQEYVFQHLLPVIQSTHNPSHFNQAMMELGALICKPKSPQCDDCPLQKNCYAFAHHAQADLPAVEKKAKVPHKHSIVLIIETPNGISLRCRTEKLWHHLWALPEMESALPPDDSAYAHAISTFLKAKSVPFERLMEISHTLSHFSVTFHPIHIQINRCVLAEPFEWVPLCRLYQKPMAVPTRKILNRIFPLKEKESV